MAAPTLVTIRPGVVFTPAAARSWKRMEAQVGRAITTNSTTRSWAEQAKLRKEWLAYSAYQNGGPWAPWAPLALRPEDSVHCQGMAADTDEVSLLKKLKDHGWRQTALAAGEDWHFEYQAKNDKHINDKPKPKPTPKPKPVPVTKKKDEMLFVRSSKTGNWFVINEFTVTSIKSGKAGTANHNHALSYSKALGKSSVSLSSTAVQELLADAAARAKTFNAGLAKTIEAMIADENSAPDAKA